MTPLTQPCPDCGGSGGIGSGGIGSGRAYCDGYSRVDRCLRCDGTGELADHCDCGAVAIHPRSGDGLPPVCESCAPGACPTCRVWGRESCSLHGVTAPANRNADCARARGFRPELKILGGELPAWDHRIRCETCGGGGALGNGSVCQFCGGEGWVKVGEHRRAALYEDDATLVDLPAFVPAKEVA